MKEDSLQNLADLVRQGDHELQLLLLYQTLMVLLQSYTSPSFLFSLWLPLGLFCFDHVEFAMTNFNDLKENHQQTLKWLSTVARGFAHNNAY